MQAFWIWALLVVSCQSPGKDASGPDESPQSPDDALHDTSSVQGDTSDSGQPQVSDSGEPPSWPGSSQADRQAAVDAMVAAAQAFLTSLSEAQRTQAQYSLGHPEQSDWSNLPHAVYARRGVSLGGLTEPQRALGWDLARASLSAAGLQRAQDIVQLEALLWEDGDPNAFPGNYFFTFFDDPSSETPWGWQLDGHHLALNFSVVAPEVTLTPSLWGVAPKLWTTGEHAGLKPMADEEDKAFEWIASLNTEQMAMAQLGADADPNLRAGPTSNPEHWPEPAGIAVSALNPSQREALLEWIAVYVGNMTEPQAAERMAEIEAHLDDVSVAWMGSTEPGSMMYYRIQGSRVLIEFDHTNSAGHIHAVYRDPQNDYGVDWLGKHLKAHHSHH